MPRYVYRGIDSQGSRVGGEVEAASLSAAAAQVKALGVAQAEVRSAGQQRAARLRGRRVSVEELIQFNTQLAAMAQAGLPLDAALNELVREMSGGRLRAAVETVAADVGRGLPLPEAMARHERALPPTYVDLVRAGLSAGNLPQLLLLMNRRLTLQQEFRRQVVDAFSYPLIILVLALTVSLGSVLIISPSVRAMLEEFYAVTPWATRAYLWFGSHVPLLLRVLGAAAAALVVALLVAGAWPAGRRCRQWLANLIPYYRRLRRVTLSGEFCAAMAMFLQAGLSVPQALRLAAHTSASEKWRAALKAAGVKVEAGEPLHEALAAQHVVPRLVVFSVRLASQRGDLPETLTALTEMYMRQGQHAMTIARVVLPLVGVAVAGTAVVFAALALLVPLVSVFRAVR